MTCNTLDQEFGINLLTGALDKIKATLLPTPTSPLRTAPRRPAQSRGRVAGTSPGRGRTERGEGREGEIGREKERGEWEGGDYA